MFDVIKYHKVADGETSSSVKYDTMAEALKAYHQFAANYMADESVLAWSLGIVEVGAGVDMRLIKRDSYARPVPVEEAAEDEPAE